MFPRRDSVSLFRNGNFIRFRLVLLLVVRLGSKPSSKRPTESGCQESNNPCVSLGCLLLVALALFPFFEVAINQDD